MSKLNRRTRRRSLRRFRELFAEPNRSHRAVRRQSSFLVESLEDRLMLSGDVGLDPHMPMGPGHDGLPGDNGPSALANSGSSIVETAAEGENTPAPDLVAFAQALDQAGAVMYGAAWCPACNAQKAAFEDGADFLPFVEVTNPDRTLNQIGIDNNITSFPTWVFPDQSREVGALPLATISQRSGVPIPNSVSPFVAPIDDLTVLGGSPLHVGLDGYDPNGGPLTFTVTSSNPGLVAPTVLSGNRSARVGVAGWGDMVFQLFEGRVPRATGRFIDLAESGFYDAANNDPDITMHRVIDNFILQFGDPTGTGAGGSSLGDFDDQFHPDLQHNNPGGISWAKAGDDTNDSQVFVIDVPTRHLDFNHSYFGQLTEGDKIRDAITATATDANNAPLVPINIESVQIFNDTENGVVMLKAAEGASGEADVTVTVTDEDGNQHVETFHVTVAPDTANGGPYLEDIPTIQTTVNTPATFQLSAVDVEGDPVLFDGLRTGSINYTVSVDSQTGDVVVTPPVDFIGTMDVLVRVRPEGSSDTGDLYDSQVVTVVVTPNAPALVDLDPSSDLGFLDDDNLTSASVLQFTITGVDDGALVRLHHGDTVIGQATATGTSAVITTSSLTPLGDGTYSLFATQIVDNIESPVSPSLDVTLDLTAPGDFTSTPPATAIIGQAVLYDAENPEEGATGAAYSLVGAPGNAGINATDGTLSWTPTSAQLGPNQFSVVISDAAGNTRSQDLNIDVQTDALVAIRLDVTDSNGTPISSIDVGGDFLLNAYVEDLRSTPEGVFAAFLDVLYDGQLVGVDGNLTFGSDYPTAQSGTISTPGLLDEVGAVSGITPLGGGEFLLFSLPMQATHAGQVQFVGDPADVGESNENAGHDVLLFGLNDAVLPEDVSYGTTSLTVNVAFGANDDLFNIDEDSAGTTLDVLDNDEIFAGSTGNLIVTQVGSTSAGGTVEIATDGKTVVYTPQPDFFGQDTFSYTVDDGTGTDQAVVTVQVTPVNDPPTAVDDTLTVTEDAVQEALDVLANDLIAPDAGETLSVVSVGTPSAGGTVTIPADGSHVLYTPQHNFFGTETFTYTVDDGNGGTSQATATVTVTGINDPPAARDDNIDVTEDTTENTLDVLANDSTEGDVGETLTIVDVGTPDQGGTVTIAADGSSLLYSPAPDFFGPERFIYTISDGNGGTAQASVLAVVSGVNDPPTATDDQFTVTKDTQNIKLDVLANDSSLPDAEEPLTVLSFSPTTAGGTVTLDNQGELLYTPPAGFTGTDTFTYTIEDDQGAQAEATATVNVLDFIPSNLSGYAYIDVNNNGRKDASEAPIGGLIITLAGTDQFEEAVNLQQVTDAHGFYQFRDLAPGTFTLSSTQPEFLIDGIDDAGVVGSPAGENELQVQVEQDSEITEVNFGERGRKPEHISVFDFFASTPRDSVLTAANPDDGLQWYAIEGGWDAAMELDVQLDKQAPAAELNVTDDKAEHHVATLNFNEPAQVHKLGVERADQLFRIVAAPHALFPDADCPCGPSEGEGEEVSGSLAARSGGDAEGEAGSAVNVLAADPVLVSAGAPVHGSDSPPLADRPTGALLPPDNLLSRAEGESTRLAEPTPANQPELIDLALAEVGEAPETVRLLDPAASSPNDGANAYAAAVDQVMADPLSLDALTP